MAQHNPKASNAISVGHRDTKARLWPHEDAGGSHNIVDDEVMRGTLVEEGNLRTAPDLDHEMHGLP